jgi:hypothetical protein
MPEYRIVIFVSLFFFPVMAYCFPESAAMRQAACLALVAQIAMCVVAVPYYLGKQRQSASWV